ncbi:VHS domain-containing protein [Melampsora americana]|nr:VHS domain-containing protein [Melampsora americana]
MLSQPNMSLNLEIADMVNLKKANTPREAAITVLQHVNRRNTHVSMLALHLLDILVKNCGYPFHLQISTKEFLNELVRRFPEKPPIFPPPPMQKILELIHEWKVTICVTSKHKEDLVHIRDMHRLLTYKGYRFPDLDRRAAQVLNESDRLKSAEELEEEDRAAQSAKLQELIRRGTPKDLAAAQELMKIMSGAEPDKQPDYEAQMQKELDRVQSRILLLNELLNNAQPGERFVDGDAFDQISQKCKQVQPKLQKWISEAAENRPEMMDRLLLINDLTNNVLDRYTSFKAGDFSATAEINPAFAGKDTATAKSQAKEVSLIDFDEPDATPTTATSGKDPSGLDLMNGLFGSISISSPNSVPIAGSSSSSSKTHTNPSPNLFYDPNPSFNTVSNTSSSTQNPSSNLSMMSGSWGANPSSSDTIRSTGSSAGPITLGNQPTSASTNQNTSVPVSNNPQNNHIKDPFADLAGLF